MIVKPAFSDMDSVIKSAISSKFDIPSCISFRRLELELDKSALIFGRTAIEFLSAIRSLPFAVPVAILAANLSKS